MRLPSLRRFLLLAGIALLACPCAAQIATLYTTDEVVLLSLINQERSRLGVQQMIWNDLLAANAQAWSQSMFNLGFVHSPAATRQNQGEVLFLAASTQYSYGLQRPMETAARIWLAQWKLYDGTPVGSASSHGWGHWSTLVWSSSNQIGCGVTHWFTPQWPYGAYIVCRTSPTGNILGESPFGPHQN